MKDEDYLRQITDEKQIASHQSALTNLRQHELERQLDLVRISVLSNPTQENIMLYYSVITTWFSYIQSLNQEAEQYDKIEAIIPKLSSTKEYWEFFKYGRIGKKVREYQKKYGNGYVIQLEFRMTQLCDEIADEIRKIYQSLKFYFRLDKSSTVHGVLGDYLRLKQKGNGGTKDDNGPIENQN